MLSLVYIPAGVGFCSFSFSPISCSEFNKVEVRESIRAEVSGE